MLGLQNYAVIQNTFLTYAAVMKRIAVLPEKLPLDNKHNQRNNVDCNPYLYYDFNNTTYYSNAYRASTPLLCIKTSDFDIQQFSEKDIKVFETKDGPTYISEEDDNSHRLIIIEHKIWKWTHQCIYNFLPKLVLPYSVQVRSTASHIINRMMQSRGKQNYRLNGSIEEDCLRLDYCCVHARRTDRLHLNGSLTTSTNIRRNLDANKNINRNTPIYLMTDEPNDHFYDELKKYYPNLFRYSDFPELYRLRHPTDGNIVNNYLLFAIELQINKIASIKYSPYVEYSKLSSQKKQLRKWRLFPLEKTGEVYARKKYDVHGSISLVLLEFYPLCKLANVFIFFGKRIMRSFLYRLSKVFSK